MPELRREPVTGRWVIISSERRNRPTSFSTVARHEEAAKCPFCPGNEHFTPPEVLAYRQPGSEPDRPGWRLRVISNRYPALKIEGSLDRAPHGIYDRMNGVGAHEVIIETAVHAHDMVDMATHEVRDILWAYRERMADLERDIRFKHIVIFKNYGQAAGSSLEHSHSQLIATPVVPKRVQEEVSGAKRYFEYKERCIFCDIVRQEISDRDRVIKDYDAFIAYEPFASRFPFETTIIPKSHQSSFLEMSDSEFTSLAVCLKDILLRLKMALNNPPFNYIIHTRPVSKEHHEYYHWHIEIIPRLTRTAGFEWGTGFYINPTEPEEAASFLRGIDTSTYQAAQPQQASK